MQQEEGPPRLARRRPFLGSFDAGGHSIDRHQRPGDLIEELVSIFFLPERPREKLNDAGIVELLGQILGCRIGRDLIVLGPLRGSNQRQVR
jgi:hypothetical protein